MFVLAHLQCIVLTMSLALIYPYNLNGIDNKFEEGSVSEKNKIHEKVILPCYFRIVGGWY